MSKKRGFPNDDMLTYVCRSFMHGNTFNNVSEIENVHQKFIERGVMLVSSQWCVLF